MAKVRAQGWVPEGREVIPRRTREERTCVENAQFCRRMPCVDRALLCRWMPVRCPPAVASTTFSLDGCPCAYAQFKKSICSRASTDMSICSVPTRHLHAARLCASLAKQQPSIFLINMRCFAGFQSRARASVVGTAARGGLGRAQRIVAIGQRLIPAKNELLFCLTNGCCDRMMPVHVDKSES